MRHDAVFRELFAQRIAIQPKDPGGMHLITTGPLQRQFDKWLFEFGNKPLIKVAWLGLAVEDFRHPA